jgi:hypothetical protein
MHNVPELALGSSAQTFCLEIVSVSGKTLESRFINPLVKEFKAH